MNIFGIGLPEMGLIMIVALLVFGPKKLPEIGRSLGKALKGFQDASKEFETEFKKEAERIEQTVAEPMKATLEKPRALTADQETADQETADQEAADQKTEPAEAEIVEDAAEEAVADVDADAKTETQTA